MAVYSMTADGGSGSALKSNTLLVNTEVYKTKQKRMLEAEDKLVLNNSAFGMENEVCGTQSVDMLADYWHKTEKTDIRFHDFACNELDALMTRILASVNEASDKTADALELEKSKDKTEVNSSDIPGVNGTSADGVAEAFDDDGQYGAAQQGPSDVAKDKPTLWENIIHKLKEILTGQENPTEREALFAKVRSYPGYENYTDEQIQALFDQLNVEGCGYAGGVNAIFAAFDGKPEEFEKTFGFPMYLPNGDLNYNMLLVDFYMETNDTFYLGDNDIYGEDALKYTILSVYTKRDDPEGFKKQFGCDLYELDENGNPKLTSSGNKELNGMAASAVADYIDNIQGDEAHFESEYGITSYGVANSLDHYLEERGVDCDVELEYRSTYDSNDVQQAIDDGKTIISGQSEFNLYNEDGTEYYGNPVGGHHMTITGVNEDGDYIVSSWGDKYILKKDEFDKISGYTVVDIDVED